MVDPLNSGLELSIELNHKKRSTQFTSAYLFEGLFEDYDNLWGFRLGVEKKFFTRQNNHSRNYYSINLVYIQLRCNDITYFNDTVTSQRIADPFTIEKKLALFQFKMGKPFFRKRFVADISIGAGAKYINTKHIDRQYPLNRKEFEIISASKNEANRITINIPATIRIGYLL